MAQRGSEQGSGNEAHQAPGESGQAEGAGYEEAELRQASEALQARGATLVPVTDNPVDRVWADRPQAARRSLAQGHPAYDFGWMWDALKVTDLRH